MVIQCEKCGTKYRFDESLIVGEGAWVRCNNCKNVFFQENPSKKKDGPQFDLMEEEETVNGETNQEIEKEIPGFDEMLSGEEREDEEKAREGGKSEEKKRGLWTPRKALAYAVIVILVLVGVYLWFFPQIRKEVFNKISHYVSTDKRENYESPNAKMEGIDFKDVKERYVKNWILGDILVIQGFVVNKYDYPVSRIKVRGKILNATGEVLDEMESYCGNLLTEEELNNLTEKEITEELSIPMGSDVSNNSIAPEGDIPFMIVFAKPSKEAEEFIVELARP